MIVPVFTNLEEMCEQENKTASQFLLLVNV